MVKNNLFYLNIAMSQFQTKPVFIESHKGNVHERFSDFLTGGGGTIFPLDLQVSEYQGDVQGPTSQRASKSSRSSDSFSCQPRTSRLRAVTICYLCQGVV